MTTSPRTLTSEDLLSFPYLSDAQIHPDGHLTAYVSGGVTHDQSKLPKRQIWVVDAEGRHPRQLTHGPRADMFPRWSPDGTLLAFLSDRLEDGHLDLYLLDLQGGEAKRAAEVKGDFDVTRHKDPLQWSPDGKFLAFLLIDPPPPDEKRRQVEKDDPIVFEQNPRFSRLWTLEVATGQLRPVTPMGAQVWEFQWSPNGRDFALIVSAQPYEWSWYEADLARVPAAGGRPRRLFRPAPRQLALPRWSPDGKHIAFLSSVWSDRGLIQGDVWLVAATGGAARDLSAGYAGSIGWMEWRKDGVSLLTAGYEQGEAAFGLLDVERRRVQTLWHAPAELVERGWPRFSLSATGNRLACLQSTPHSVRNVWRADLRGKRLLWKRVTDVLPRLSDWALGDQEIIRWKSRDGWTIHGVLIKPVGYEEGKRYPTIVSPHGGPTGLVPDGFLGYVHWGQLLAAKGYAVFLPNFRGSAGFGLAFAEANLGDMGGKDFEDIDSGVDALIERGIADPSRLGFGGWSYGGFMTCWTLTQTTRYRAAVMGAGITNWLSFHGNSHLCTWDAIHYATTPYDGSGLYARFSAMNLVARVKTPTLILHGERDRDVPSEQSYQFHRALRDHGVETQLVIYPREGHGIEETRHWLDLRKRILAWYDDHLK